MNLLVKLIDNVRRFGIEKVFRRYYSQYYAQVVSVVDPENRGRILLRVPGILGEQTLPNYAKYNPPWAGSNFGQLWEVEENDWVLVWFDKGNLNYPNWCSGWWGRSEKPNELSHENKVSGIVTRSGHKILFYDKGGEEKILIEDKGGSYFIFDPVNQRIQLNSIGKEEVSIATDSTKTVGGGWKIDVTGVAVIKCKNIKLGSTSSSERLILGDLFKAKYNLHTHIGNLAVPTGPPIVPMADAELSDISKTEK